MRRGRQAGAGAGFTLIELLVVVAIIALLISIMVPSLGNARRGAKATKCSANLRDVGVAFATYLAENNGTYPVAYAYPYDGEGHWDPQSQDQYSSHPYGYVHWSWFLYAKGAVRPDVFTCPEIPNGGLPRTNPGVADQDWEPQQRNQGGQSRGGATLEDKQAPRMAFTCNAAIVPRNKFVQNMDEGGLRMNQFVQESRIRESRGVILATEWSKDYVNITPQSDAAPYLVKSHRPISPFWDSSCNYQLYTYGPNRPLFLQYGDPSEPDFGIKPQSMLDGVPGIVEGARGNEVNAVGRHHPGNDKYGGSANFLYVDGHGARKTILRTMLDREWGGEYYSLTGENKVGYAEHGSSQ